MLQRYIARVLEYRGFANQTTKDEMLMLCEEVGELAKAIRQHEGRPKAVDSASFAVSEEIADVIWMAICVANRLDIDVESAICAKEERNKKRSWQ